MKGFNYNKELGSIKCEDWVFGAESKTCMAIIPKEKRFDYLPKGEVQKGKEDFMDCATRCHLNILETKFNFLIKEKKIKPEVIKWLDDMGYIINNQVEFSDRFNAILSNTTRDGNSLKNPLESIRKNGLIPKKMLPANSNMTWEDYHNEKDITDKMLKLGKEFLSKFRIQYDRVFKIEDCDDMLSTACYAWSVPINGIYPPIINEPNHAIDIIKPKYFIYDNYYDLDGDFIKELSPDYKFLSYGYRIFLNINLEVMVNNILVEFILILKNYVKHLSEKLNRPITEIGSIFTEIFEGEKPRPYK